MSPLKIGIIGGGGIAGAHLPHLSTHSEVELVALSDPNPAAAATAQQFCIPHFFGDYRELLPLVDAVLICAPTFLHAEIAMEALHAGKAVFCEKPLARTWEQAQAIESAVKRSGSPMQVGFVRRFDEEWLAWREALLQEKIGRPVIWHDISSFSGPPSPWFFRDEQGGGPFLDGCVHNFDFALHTFGPAKWAFCHGHTLRQETTAIDTGTATIRFQSGDELMLAWSWGLPDGAPAARVFELLGPKGTITWPRTSANDAICPYFLVHQGVSEEEISFPTNALTLAFKSQMDEFVAVARREKQPQAGIEAGCEALRLALAVLESARSGEIVRF